MPAGPIRNLVTGGAGFLGSHLVDRLMQAGEEVLCLDNTFTGRKANVRQWWDHSRFEFIRHDVTDPIKLEVDRIWHLACPASPILYQTNPVKTAKTSFLGTYNMLGLARRVKARLLAGHAPLLQFFWAQPMQKIFSAIAFDALIRVGWAEQGTALGTPVTSNVDTTDRMISRF